MLWERRIRRSSTVGQDLKCAYYIVLCFDNVFSLVLTVLHLSVFWHERARNKLWYFQLATSETISASCRNLKECLTIEVNDCLIAAQDFHWLFSLWSLQTKLLNVFAIDAQEKEGDLTHLFFFARHVTHFILVRDLQSHDIRAYLTL